MFFDDWFGLLRVFVLGVAAYLALIATLRVSGKRTLAKMSAFDLIVTVALGSTLATIVLTEQVALVEGLLAFLVLVTLQYVIAALAVRYRRAETLIKSAPRTVLRDGRFEDDAMKDERITHADVLAAIRSAGLGDIAAVAAVVLEADGTLSVVSREKLGSGSALPGRAEP